MKNIKFGRLVEFDQKSRNFPVRSLISSRFRPRSYTWLCLLNLNQGDSAACVGFSFTHEAAASPVEIKDLDNETALLLYHRARELDQFDGEDYEGSSVLGGAKAGQELGWYGEYRWAFSETDLCLAIGYKGPAVIGINWYEGMNEPDRRGIIKTTGPVEGGHAILCTGIDIKTGLYRLHNSWGTDWGVHGDCFISRDDMVKLLDEEGEACILTERLEPVE